MKNDLYYGSNNFWGIGIVEDINDPLQAGRVKVRIYGIHTPDKRILPTSDLPWSQVMAPINSASISGVGVSPVGPRPGTMVYGVFLDGSLAQQFLVQGTMPGIRKTSTVQVQTGEPSIVNTPVEDFGNSRSEQLFNIAKAKGLDETRAAGLVAAVAEITGQSFDPETSGDNTSFGIGLFNNEDRLVLDRYASRNNATVYDFKTQAEYLVDKVSGNVEGFPKITTVQISQDSVNSLSKPIETAFDAANAFIQRIFRKNPEDVKVNVEKYSREAEAAYGSNPNDADTGSFESKRPADPLGKFSIVETVENLVYYLEQARDNRQSGSNRIRGLIVHHTDTFENMNTDAREIDRWHVNEKNFSEIGYHFVILRDGRIQIGRSATKRGAHSSANNFLYNRIAIGLALVGGRVGDSSARSNRRSAQTFTTEQWRAFDRFIAAWLQVFPDSFQKGHRDIQPGNRTDPEFDVEEYVANRYSDFKAIPSQSEQPVERQRAREAGTAPVAVDPTTPPEPSSNEPEVVTVPVDTDSIESAPIGPIQLPDFDPINFPSIPDPNDFPIINIGDLFGGGGGGGTATGGNADTLNNQPGSYYLNFSNFTNLPSPTLTVTGDASGTATFTELGNATLNLTVSGGGTLNATGTPVDNQLAIWTGADTLEGDANLTWDGTDLTVTGNIVSPTLTGTPVAPTATAGTNTTQIATTEFVTNAVTSAGGGDVSKVGTPVDNQIGVWTGNGTIEGDANLTWDTTVDTLSVRSNQSFVSPDGTHTIDISMLNTDTLAFSGGSGQLFSISDSMTGTIFSVNDISGIPSIEVDSSGTITLAEFSGNVGIGVAAPTSKLEVAGIVESTTGGIKFPDGTTQVTAAVGGVASVSVTTGVANQTEILYTFPTSTYSGAEFVITVEEGGERQISKILVTYNGSDAYGTEYGTVLTNTSLAEFSVDILSGNVRLITTSASTNSTVYRIQPVLLDN